MLHLLGQFIVHRESSRGQSVSYITLQTELLEWRDQESNRQSRVGWKISVALFKCLLYEVEKLRATASNACGILQKIGNYIYSDRARTGDVPCHDNVPRGISTVPGEYAPHFKLYRSSYFGY